jgi:hypothetical protein
VNEMVTSGSMSDEFEAIGLLLLSFLLILISLNKCVKIWLNL